MKRLFKRPLVVVLIALVAFALSSCSGLTDPATDITSTAATLNARVSCQTNEHGTWWFRWRASGGTWIDGPHQGYECSGGWLSNQPLTYRALNLTPSTHYQFEICAAANGFDPHCANADGQIWNANEEPGAPLDAFDTLSEAYQHVVWVIMENHGYDQIAGSSSAPYINSLISQYGSATNMFAETHPSLPNYIAMTSGSTQGVTDDGNPPSHPLDVENIFHQLGGGQSRSLEESMPSNCYTSDFIDASGGKYSAHHNPMPYYTNLGTDCANYDVPLGSTPDVSAKFTLVTPNQTSNMHDGTITDGDNFLQGFIPKIQSTADYQAGKTVIFVTWDEDEGSEGNHIPTVVIHPNGAHDTSACQGTRYDHYSMLRYVEDNFGLARIGNAASATSMSGCFGLN
jgi:phosphatidylinositol-3-phosphatase